MPYIGRRAPDPPRASSSSAAAASTGRKPEVTVRMHKSKILRLLLDFQTRFAEWRTPSGDPRGPRVHRDVRVTLIGVTPTRTRRSSACYNGAATGRPTWPWWLQHLPVMKDLVKDLNLPLHGDAEGDPARRARPALWQMVFAAPVGRRRPPHGRPGRPNARPAPEKGGGGRSCSSAAVGSCRCVGRRQRRRCRRGDRR